MEVSVSFLGSKNINETIEKLNKTDCEYIHVDVMDGIYTENKTMDFDELKPILSKCNKKLDIHLMCKNPTSYIYQYSQLHPEYISIQYDCINRDACIDIIRAFGCKVGIVFNPDQLVDASLLRKVDLILIMTVVPGKPGQKLIDTCIGKINGLKKFLDMNMLYCTIECDGGVNLENVAKLKNCDIIVSGSCVTNSLDYQDTINKLRGI